MATPSSVLVLLSITLAVSMAYPLGLEEEYGLGGGFEDGASFKIEEENHEPISYSYKYGVHDAHTGDFKSASEQGHGDFVSGQYQLLQPDGLTRIVKYTADKHNGFNAKVFFKHD